MKAKKLLAAMSLSLFAAVAAAQYSIDWFKVAGGGGTSSGGNFGLSGTIGQADAGVMSGGPFSLTGGFWAVGIVQVAWTPALTLLPAGPGQATLNWSPDTSGFSLQVNDTLTGTVWTNAPSGTNHPITIPTFGPMKFYRLIQP